MFFHIRCPLSNKLSRRFRMLSNGGLLSAITYKKLCTTAEKFHMIFSDDLAFFDFPSVRSFGLQNFVSKIEVDRNMIWEFLFENEKDTTGVTYSSFFACHKPEYRKGVPQGVCERPGFKIREGSKSKKSILWCIECWSFKGHVVHVGHEVYEVYGVHKVCEL